MNKPTSRVLLVIALIIFYAGLNYEAKQPTTSKNPYKQTQVTKQSKEPPIIKADNNSTETLKKFLKKNVSIYKHSVHYTKSKDYKDVYFIGGFINKNGIIDRCIWTVSSGVINYNGGIVLSANKPALEFSNAPNGERSKTQISKHDDGYLRLARHLSKIRNNL